MLLINLRPLLPYPCPYSAPPSPPQDCVNSNIKKRNEESAGKGDGKVPSQRPSLVSYMFFQTSLNRRHKVNPQFLASRAGQW